MRSKHIGYLLFFLVLQAFSIVSMATSDLKLWQNVKTRLRQIWFEGQGDLYIPFYDWHNRWTYPAENIASYNESPWGMGIGKSIWDEHQNLQGLYAIVFLDSHKNVQPMGGYVYSFVFHPTESTGLGLAFTLMMTARQDILNNVPFPGALPALTLNYKKLMLMAVYVPGAHHYGNVLFLTFKLTLT